MHSSAEQIGYLVGVVIGILLLLSVLVFSAFAVIKAFTKKTTGWIVAGSIGGAILLFLGVTFAIGFLQGFSQALHNRAEKTDDGAKPVKLAESQTLRGINIAYSIKIPSDWTVQRQKQAFDLVANQKSVFVGVVAEDVDLGGTETVLNFAKANIKEIAEDVVFSDPIQELIDGHSWQRFTVKCHVEKIPFYYQYHVYSGPEGTFQIISWTLQNLAEKNDSMMSDVAETFTFPR